MSGSAALAAARRRRAGPQVPPPPSPQRNRVEPANVSNDIQSSNVTPTTSTPSTRINPTQMLMNHNKLIENLNRVVDNINQKVDKEVMSKDEIKQLVKKSVEDAMSTLELKDDNIEFFKNKYSKMSNQLQEIKKHVIKVQTFAMETNLQCIELKKKMFREKNESKNMDQIMKNDPHKLTISSETQEKHIEQIKQTTNVSDILHDGDDNKIIE
tara:strand:- start:1051 stop:1686 length:636 start_codon:yes stop_codon:yes gene_type:complete